MREEYVRQIRLRELSAEQTAAIQDWPLGTAALRVAPPRPRVCRSIALAEPWSRWPPPNRTGRAWTNPRRLPAGATLRLTPVAGCESPGGDLGDWIAARLALTADGVTLWGA